MRPLICALSILLLTSLYGDKVFLNDGRVIKGKVVKETEDEVVVEGKYGRVRFERSDVERIEYGDEEKDEQRKPKKPEGGKIETLIERYLSGDEESVEELKGYGDDAVVAVLLAIKGAKMAEKMHLEALFERLTEVSDEREAECKRWYKEGLRREKEWRDEYDALRKQGLSAREAVVRTKEKWAMATKCFQNTVKANKWYKDAMLRAGVLLYSGGSAPLYKKAIEMLDLLVRAGDELAMKTSGAAAFKLREWKRCIEFLRPLSESKDIDVLTMLLQSYLALKKPSKAEKVLKRLKKLIPDDYRVHASYGCLYLLRKRFKDAVRALKRALEKGDRSVSTRFNLASALEQLGRTEEAIQYYEEVLKLSPGDYATLLRLASLYTKVGRYDDAERLLEEFLRRYPGSPGARTAKKALKALKERKR